MNMQLSDDVEEQPRPRFDGASAFTDWVPGRDARRPGKPVEPLVLYTWGIKGKAPPAER